MKDPAVKYRELGFKPVEVRNIINTDLIGRKAASSQYQ
jgi:hypothetical protein